MSIPDTLPAEVAQAPRVIGPSKDGPIVHDVLAADWEHEGWRWTGYEVIDPDRGGPITSNGHHPLCRFQTEQLPEGYEADLDKAAAFAIARAKARADTCPCATARLERVAKFAGGSS